MTLKYEYDKVALKATVCGVEDCGTNVVIPATVEYYKKVYKVTSIGKSAFEGCKVLESIVIPNNVASIGDTAFTRCESLTSIEIPNSVTSIGEGAFCACTGLTSIEIPNSVTTSIGKCAFYGCEGLKNVTIGNRVTSIGYQAFYKCKGLTSIEIPNSVTSIGEGAFCACTGLTSIVIPSSVTSIGEDAFCACSGLTSIEIPQSVTRIHERAFLFCKSLSSIKVDPGNTIYDSRDNCNAIIETQTNTLIHGCNRTVVPDSVTSIANCAFHSRECLTNVVFPAGLKSIGKDAFMDCSRLASLEIPDSVTSIGNKAFDGCSALNRVEVGYGNTVYDSRDNCNAIIETRTNALIKGGNMTVIPNGVTSIGYQAFRGCSGLTSVVIPNSVTSIGYQAFRGCSGLTSVEIGNSVTSIGYQAFRGCSGLTSVVIPNSVTSIGDQAFGNTVWYNNQPDGLVYAGRVLYKYKGTMPKNTSIIVKEGSAGIGSSAFEGCTGLTSIVIPNSVTSIGVSAFDGCEGLKNVTIGNRVTSIESFAFCDCSGLTSVEIPNSVTSIGEWAFKGCSGLTSIEIPSCVEKIHEDAFREIPNLQVDIYNEEGEVLIHPNAFRGDAKINYLGKKKVKEDKTTKVAKTSNETNDKKEEQAPVIDLDKLIDAVVADGVITEKERSVILKKATAAGYDADEVEILLDGKLAEKQNAEKVVTKEPKKAPAKKEAAPVTEVVTPEEKSAEGGRNYSKYSVNGAGSYGKGRMVEAVVKKYVELNPATTVQKLKEVFPERLQGSNFIKDSTETITDMKRYYEATLPGGVKFYISNQWGTQTDAFMEYVNNSFDGITVTKV